MTALRSQRKLTELLENPQNFHLTSSNRMYSTPSLFASKGWQFAILRGSLNRAVLSVEEPI